MNLKLSGFLVAVLLYGATCYASGEDCDDPKAVPKGTPDVAMDGFFIGANTCAYDPDLVSSDDVPVIGGEYQDGGEPIFMVNGANTSVSNNDIRLKSIATVKHRPVIGIYNATTDAVGELTKFVDIGNLAANTIRREAFSRVMEGREFSVIALSQSGFMVGRGLTLLKTDLYESFPFRYLYRQHLLNLVNVETVGTLGMYYPDGPNYVHYVNKRDLFPLIVGAGSEASKPGRGAVIATFYYYNEDCQFGMAPLEEYPGENADLSKDKPPVVGEEVHSVCSYAASGMDFDSLRTHAPQFGTVEVELDLSTP